MTALSQFVVSQEDRHRAQQARTAQDYDSDPPRCFTCVFFHRGPLNPIRAKRRKGKHGPEVIEMCKFGNFPVTYKGVCNEWRSRAGERLAESDAAPPEQPAGGESPQENQ